MHQTSSNLSSTKEIFNGSKNNEVYKDKLLMYKVIRRNGSVVKFEPSKISIALTKAFLAVNGGKGAASARIREIVEKLSTTVVGILTRRLPSGGTFHIEDIQDQVELALMRSGEHEVARSYVLYREERNKNRAKNLEQNLKTDLNDKDIKIKNIDGSVERVERSKLLNVITECCCDLDGEVDPNLVLDMSVRDLYDGVSIHEMYQSLILASRSLIEKDPAYNFVSSRLLLYKIRIEVLGENISQEKMQDKYKESFPSQIKKGVDGGLLDPKIADFDLNFLAKHLIADRDFKFTYLGLQTLYDRYFLHLNEERIELPQIFFMRVAMGLAIDEVEREKRAIEFYDLLSNFDFMSSTPTLFNSGTIRSQLSSCYLTTVEDDLDGIYEAIKENALLSKFAGGLGNDWSSVRALGSHIKGTNGKSQGVVPFLKVVNDTAVAVNQGGKRKGAVCAYLETWHLDIEEFLDLRKNTGDDRRRTHDMNTANWIPDLFMKRVYENGKWSLFCPSDVPNLHELYGKKFEVEYLRYEEKGKNGEFALFKEVSAVELWRKMLTMLFETGHPWITFKDPCNIRSPQNHTGIVHSSNLCTEITLNTSEFETAVCNLGSVNLPAHLFEGKLDHKKLEKTINIAMRMLDNVIDINYYAVSKARSSNLKHRPVGLGMMGFQDCLQKLNIPYASKEAVEFSDKIAEAVCFYSYQASSVLAEERGKYSTYDGSLWSSGILPQDSLEILEKERGGYLQVDKSSQMDWVALRKRIEKSGLRNSNCVAIAPTATIANIVGVSASIEPTYQNLYVKSNLSGEFTVVNSYLVNELKKINLWDEVMIADLKYYDGAISKIDRIPEKIRKVFASAFEIDPSWLVECASRRQKWIDQSQSLNIYISGASGKKLDEVYRLAWEKGLKTTYYLRTIGATAAEKSTSKTGHLNSVSNEIPRVSNHDSSTESQNSFCSLDDSECEACQ